MKSLIILRDRVLASPKPIGGEVRQAMQRQRIGVRVRGGRGGGPETPAGRTARKTPTEASSVGRKYQAPCMGDPPFNQPTPAPADRVGVELGVLRTWDFQKRRIFCQFRNEYGRVRL